MHDMRPFTLADLKSRLLQQAQPGATPSALVAEYAKSAGFSCAASGDQELRPSRAPNRRAVVVVKDVFAVTQTLVETKEKRRDARGVEQEVVVKSPKQSEALASTQRQGDFIYVRDGSHEGMFGDQPVLAKVDVANVDLNALLVEVANEFVPTTAHASGPASSVSVNVHGLGNISIATGAAAHEAVGVIGHRHRERIIEADVPVTMLGGTYLVHARRFTVLQPDLTRWLWSGGVGVSHRVSIGRQTTTDAAAALVEPPPVCVRHGVRGPV